MIDQLDCSNNPMLRASYKTRSVISLLAKVTGWDRLILSYRVQCSEIGITGVHFTLWKGSNKQFVGYGMEMLNGDLVLSS